MAAERRRAGQVEVAAADHGGPPDVGDEDEVDRLVQRRLVVGAVEAGGERGVSSSSATGARELQRGAI